MRILRHAATATVAVAATTTLLAVPATAAPTAPAHRPLTSAGQSKENCWPISLENCLRRGGKPTTYGQLARRTSAGISGSPPGC
ncbi:hypothetical protein [Actinomadura logoneensis]|uniref:hypothetical protein n=1 Tax=Actinomadura logoneensis TaxID=2293572 RepID=UPI0011C0EE31|nr:hypothetical protein [Actinomadura logoneensis]